MDYLSYVISIVKRFNLPAITASTSLFIDPYGIEIFLTAIPCLINMFMLGEMLRLWMVIRDMNGKQRLLIQQRRRHDPHESAQEERPPRESSSGIELVRVRSMQRGSLSRFNDLWRDTKERVDQLLNMSASQYLLQGMECHDPNDFAHKYNWGELIAYVDALRRRTRERNSRSNTAEAEAARRRMREYLNTRHLQDEDYNRVWAYYTRQVDLPELPSDILPSNSQVDDEMPQMQN